MINFKHRIKSDLLMFLYQTENGKMEKWKNGKKKEMFLIGLIFIM